MNEEDPLPIHAIEYKRLPLRRLIEQSVKDVENRDRKEHLVTINAILAGKSMRGESDKTTHVSAPPCRSALEQYRARASAVQTATPTEP